MNIIKIDPAIDNLKQKKSKPSFFIDFKNLLTGRVRGREDIKRISRPKIRKTYKNKLFYQVQ